MIIINKKRIILILLVLFVSVVSFSFKKSNDVVSVSSLPVTNKVIILDAGHGLPDEGDKKLTQDIKQLIFAVK